MRNKLLSLTIISAVSLTLSAGLTTKLSAQAEPRRKINTKAAVDHKPAPNFQEIDAVIFVPENRLIRVVDYNGNEINPASIKELKVSTITKKGEDTGDRITRAASFLLTGGLSVTGSIQRSMKNGQADNRLADNFIKPMKSIRDGWKADDNEFLVNYVGHPFEFFMLGSYLKASGASDREAILISQITNLTWEYVAEGCYVPPSPKDLASDTIGSLLGIYLYNKGITKKPIDYTYGTLAYIGKKHDVDLIPNFRYNSQTRGMMIGATIKIKK